MRPTMNAGWLTVTYGKAVQSFSLSSQSIAAITMRFNYIVLCIFSVMKWLVMDICDWM